MHSLLNDTLIHDAIDSGDMVLVKPYLDTTPDGVSFEGEHSGKVGIVIAFSTDSAHRDRPNKAVVQIRHDDGTRESFTHDLAGLVLLERRARDRK